MLFRRVVEQAIHECAGFLFLGSWDLNPDTTRRQGAAFCAEGCQFTQDGCLETRSSVLL